jgi:hypothetical protein
MYLIHAAAYEIPVPNSYLPYDSSTGGFISLAALFRSDKLAP